MTQILYISRSIEVTEKKIPRYHDYRSMSRREYMPNMSLLWYPVHWYNILLNSIKFAHFHEKKPKREILLLRWRWGLLLGVPLEGNLTCMIFAIGWPNWSSYSLLVLDINFFYPDFIRLPCMERQIDRCMYSINWRALPLIRELSNCIWFPDINVQWLYPDILWVHIRKADLAHINDPIGRYTNGRGGGMGSCASDDEHARFLM